jgi:hypothetical protein
MTSPDGGDYTYVYDAQAMGWRLSPCQILDPEATLEPRALEEENAEGKGAGEVQLSGRSTYFSRTTNKIGQSVLCSSLMKSISWRTCIADVSSALFEAPALTDQIRRRPRACAGPSLIITKAHGFNDVQRF